MPFLKRLFQFCIPSAILFGVACILEFRAVLPAGAQPLLRYFPPLAAALGILLGWRFNRTRVIWAILLLVGMERGLAMLTLYGREYLLAVGTLLLPLNVLMFAWWRERGLFTVHGLIRFLIVAVEVGLVTWGYQARAGEVMAALAQPYLVFLPEQLFGFPQLGMAVTGFALLGLLVRYGLRPGALEASFCWALASVCLGLWQPHQFAFWAGVAALILTVAVIEGSFTMAFNDELTGLPARRAMNEYLLKVGRRYTIAMVDVDHFKKVNDTYGHDIGDQVLRMVAARLQQVSGGGRAFRYGGEEFAVIFSGKETPEALSHLEELREKIARSGFVLRGRNRPKNKPQKPPKKSGDKTLQVTASIGVASRSETLATADAVIKAADQALYKAKKGGRNKVCHGG